MSGDLVLDKWTAAALEKLDYVRGNLGDALHNYQQLFGEQHDEVHDAIVGALAAVDIREHEIREAATVEDVEHAMRQLDAVDDTNAEAAE